jgi:hypothetical protein
LARGRVAQFFWASRSRRLGYSSYQRRNRHAIDKKGAMPPRSQRIDYGFTCQPLSRVAGFCAFTRVARLSTAKLNRRSSLHNWSTAAFAGEVRLRPTCRAQWIGGQNATCRNCRIHLASTLDRAGLFEAGRFRSRCSLRRHARFRTSLTTAATGRRTRMSRGSTTRASNADYGPKVPVRC